MWWCEHCKRNVEIIIDTYDIHAGELVLLPQEIRQFVVDNIEWDVVCAECEHPAEWRD